MSCVAQDLVCFQENERTKDLIIEQRFHRAIIGQKGEKIKEVRDKFPEVSWKHLLSVDIFISLNLLLSRLVFNLFKQVNK